MLVRTYNFETIFRFYCIILCIIRLNVALKALEILELEDIEDTNDDEELDKQLKEKKKEYDEAERQNPPRDTLHFRLSLLTHQRAREQSRIISNISLHHITYV